jgi:hypothetical protein
MEDIFAHVVDEEAPYRLEFDEKAVIFDLRPGEVISWPLNAPHRVTNIEAVNVSLSTLHVTEDSDRRKLVYCANRLLRRCAVGIASRSDRPRKLVVSPMPSSWLIAPCAVSV